MDQLINACRLHMEYSDIAVIEDYAIEMHSGKVVELNSHSLFFSLSYPTEPSRVFEMQFGAPDGATIH